MASMTMVEDPNQRRRETAKPDFPFAIFFLRPAIDRAPGALSIATFKKKIPYRKSDFAVSRRR